ncbi:MAG: VCBS repeat-containing protein [Planctomycetota bacterium]
MTHCALPRSVRAAAALLALPCLSLAQDPPLLPVERLDVASTDGSKTGAIDGALADLNLDGALDQATALTSGGAVAVQLGDGTGGFGAPTHLTFTDGLVAVVAADWNNDGAPDLAAAGSVGFDTTVAIRLNDGSGGFGPVTTNAVEGAGYAGALRAVEVDGDENEDLIVYVELENFFDSSGWYALRGDGTGAFGTPFNFMASSSANYIGMEVGDFDNDGAVERAVGFASSGQVWLYESILFGGFTFAGQSLVPGVDPDGIAVTDVDDDHDADVIAVKIIAGEGVVHVLLGDGSFGMSQGGTANIGPITLGQPGVDGDANVVAADVNGDGGPDLIITDFDAGRTWISLQTFAAYGPAVEVRFGSATLGNTEVGDLNGDGLGDLSTPVGGSRVAIALAGPDGLPVEAVASAAAGEPDEVLLTDLDGDAVLDAVTVDTAGAVLATALGDGAGGFGAPASTAVAAGPVAAAAADWNGDQAPDVVVAHGAAQSVALLLGDGAGGLAAGPSAGLGADAVDVALGDLNADGDVDALVLHDQATTVLGDGAGGFAAVLPVTLCAGGCTFPPRQARLGDVDLDGTLDLLYVADPTEFLASKVSILYGEGTGDFQSAVTVPIEGSDLHLADLNEDGAPDLVVESSSLRLALNNGAGFFSLTDTLPSAGELAPCDLNADGHMDFAGTSGLVYLGDGSGGLTGGGTFTLLDPVAVTAADVDRDGQVDVVAAGGGEVRAALNQTPCPSLVAPYGSGCPGSGGFVPELGLTGCPEAGASFDLNVSSGLGGAAAVLLIGSSEANVPIAAGCSLLLGGLLPTSLALGLGGDAAGLGSTVLPIPLQPTVPPGVVVTTQVFVLDPGVPSLLAATNGLRIEFP